MMDNFIFSVVSFFFGVFIVLVTGTSDIKNVVVLESNKVCETNGGVESITAYMRSSWKTETKCVNGAKFMMDMNK